MHSMSHSFSSSFYDKDIKSHNPGYGKNNLSQTKNIEKLAELSNDRRSMLSTPMVEFDTLGQVSNQNQHGKRYLLSENRTLSSRNSNLEQKLLEE